MKIETLPEVLKFYFFYSLVLVIVGICKTEMVINAGEKTYSGVIRMSSYISLPIMVIAIFALLSALFGLVWYCLKLHSLVLSIQDFVNAISYYIFGLIANETLKFALLFIFFLDDLDRMNGNVTDESLRQTLFYEYSNYSDVSFCIISAALFGFSLNALGYSPKLSILSFFYLILSMVLVYLIFTY